MEKGKDRNEMKRVYFALLCTTLQLCIWLVSVVAEPSASASASVARGPSLRAQAHGAPSSDRNISNRGLSFIDSSKKYKEIHFIKSQHPEMLCRRMNMQVPRNRGPKQAMLKCNGQQCKGIYILRFLANIHTIFELAFPNCLDPSQTCCLRTRSSRVIIFPTCVS